MVNASIEMLQDQVARDLMELRYVHGLSEPDIEHVKEAAKRWSHDQAAVAAQKLMEKRLFYEMASTWKIFKTLSGPTYLRAFRPRSRRWPQRSATFPSWNRAWCIPTVTASRSFRS